MPKIFGLRCVECHNEFRATPEEVKRLRQAIAASLLPTTLCAFCRMLHYFELLATKELGAHRS